MLIMLHPWAPRWLGADITPSTSLLLPSKLLQMKFAPQARSRNKKCFKYTPASFEKCFKWYMPPPENASNIACNGNRRHPILAPIYVIMSAHYQHYEHSSWVFIMSIHYEHSQWVFIIRMHYETVRCTLYTAGNKRQERWRPIFFRGLDPSWFG